MNSVENEKDAVNKEEKRKIFTVQNMARIAVLSAISFVLYMFVKTPLAFFPSWLDIQVSDIPALLGGFAMGPWAGIAVIIIKCCLKLPFTSTAYVGEIADMLIGIALVLPASLIYGAKKSKKRAVIALLVGTLSSTAAAMLANRFILIPLYTKLFLPWEALLGSLSALYGKTVTMENFYAYYLFLAVLPFNLIRLFLVDIVTLGVYKPLRNILHS